MRRLLVVLCVAALFAGCGFKPRAQLALASDLGPVAVSTADPYSPLGQGLATALRRAGVAEATAGQPSATLQVVSENMRTRPLAVDAAAQVREYETIYTVEFELRGADGAVRVPRQAVELSREYTYDALASAGSPAEQQLLQDELRRDMQAAILRRIDAALRAD
ncbi:MAG: LPS assembly lipoprotein LptE [Arenimonas sp.]|nr:LPS assembly lipoprotein LptE [Arenimonas sp.]